MKTNFTAFNNECIIYILELLFYYMSKIGIKIGLRLIVYATKK